MIFMSCFWRPLRDEFGRESADVVKAGLKNQEKQRGIS